MASGPVTLSQLAHMAGVSAYDARRYTEQGLLQPARRRKGKATGVALRQEHLDRLKLIRRALVQRCTRTGPRNECAILILKRAAERVAQNRLGSIEITPIGEKIGKRSRAGISNRRRGC
jgi:hypothetical protein